MNKNNPIRKISFSYDNSSQYNVPHVTILLPVYNGEDTIRRCINSIKCQKENNFVVLISDNCSTDSTYEILNELTNSDSRFIIKRQSVNLGAIGNFLYLIDKVKTPYVMYLGADDYINSFYISESLKVLTNDHSISMVSPNVIYTHKNFSYHGVAKNNLNNNISIRLINYFLSVTDNGIFYCLTRSTYLKNIMLELLPKLRSKSGEDHFVIASLLIKGGAKKINSVFLFRTVGKASMEQLNKYSYNQNYLWMLLTQSFRYLQNYILCLRHHKIHFFKFLLVFIIILFRHFFKRPLGVYGSIYIKQPLLRLLNLNATK